MAKETLHQRRQAVLHAIVADYIAFQEPVGSKALLERHKLQVSSATIRNDMAALEAEGYIASQHTSSGRVPTQKGYRVFVDHLHDLKPLSAAERRAILSFLEGGVDVEDVLRRSVQLLSQLTRQAAVVQLPNLQVSRVKHCEVVLLSPVRLLLVMITDAGRVEQRRVELDQVCSTEQVAKIRDVLNAAMEAKTLSDASISLAQLADATQSHIPVDPEIQGHVLRCATVLLETLIETPNDRLILAGASNLSRVAANFPEGLPPILEALEEQVVFLKLLANLDQPGQISVLIGEESENDQLSQTSVVATGYGYSDGRALGGLGVVGPTHLDYLGTMSKVAAVAQYVSRVIEGS